MGGAREMPMKLCMCKNCDAVEVSTWGDLRRVFLCICCSGYRLEEWEH